MPERAGRLIAFEGTEGAGKSTQIQRAAEALRQVGHAVRVTAAPGGTVLGQEIRRLVLHQGDDVPTPLAELFLYLADRAQHVATTLAPALAAGEIVLVDRFSASTIAYQGFGRGIDIDLVTRLEAAARNGVTADLTILLDCPVRVGLQRAREPDRIHDEIEAFHERVRGGFLQLAAQQPAAWRVIDSTQSKDDVHRQIMDAVTACLGDRAARRG